MIHSEAHSPAIAARRSLVERLGTDRFDVLVIGGGITGAGIARDAALRGLRVALVERDDFASGTSSRSSRLVHGGVRYLEHGYLHLVFESSRERRTLLRIAPHLVRPLRFTWPVYQGARIPRWKLGAGLTLYDALSLFRNVARHRRLDAREVLRDEPLLGRAGLEGGAQYYDAATDDARLTLANVQSAMLSGAVAVNHVEAVELVRDTDGRRVVGAVVRDALGGASVTVAASVVVNAGGPWSDDVRALDESAPAAVRGTKGVHVAVPRERVGNRGALTLLSPTDGRVMFVLPGAGGAESLAIIGTTDSPTRTRPDDVRASRADVSYLLDAANTFFPESRLGERDIVAAWAGIRPLAASGYGSGPASASREHAIHRSKSGVVHVTGGKLTTFRAMASEVVDEVGTLLGRRLGASSTARLPLPGGSISNIDVEIASAAAMVGDGEVAARLVRAHGLLWRDVWSMTDLDRSLRDRMTPTLPFTFAEVAFAAAREMAHTLADVLVRRVPLAFTLAQHARGIAPTVARVIAPTLGWGAARIGAEVERYDRDVDRLFAIDP